MRALAFIDRRGFGAAASSVGKGKGSWICPKATQALGSCLDGALVCGGWEVLMETGGGDKAPAPPLRGPGDKEMRMLWPLPFLRLRSHWSTYSYAGYAV